VKNIWREALIVVLGLLGAGVIFIASSPPRGDPIQLLPPPTPAPIQVYITGAVNQPGIYALPVNARIYDAIQAAGGFTDNANDQVINLAAFLQDGGQIWVPSTVPDRVSEYNAGSQNASHEQHAQATIVELININTAPQEVLETLPEIGPKTAENIITYRQNEGFFTSIEEIQKVPGIGPATYEAIKDRITVGAP
jgi:competence protein ComEA